MATEATTADDKSIAAAAEAAAAEVADIASSTETSPPIAISLEGCANPNCQQIELASGDLISKLKRCAACGDAGYW